jgi:hypothetical protein
MVLHLRPMNLVDVLVLSCKPCSEDGERKLHDQFLRFYYCIVRSTLHGAKLRIIVHICLRCSVSELLPETLHYGSRSFLCITARIPAPRCPPTPPAEVYFCCDALRQRKARMPYESITTLQQLHQNCMRQPCALLHALVVIGVGFAQRYLGEFECVYTKDSLCVRSILLMCKCVR